MDECCVSLEDFVLIDPVAPSTEVRRGICRFIGETEFADGLWVGVELVGSVGKNSGSVYDRQYFDCLPQQGVFVRPELVRPFCPPSVSPPPPCHLEGSVELQLRVEMEELRELLEHLNTQAKKDKETIESLEVDLEIAREQALLLGEELDEARLLPALTGAGSSPGGGGRGQSVSANDANETIVALTHRIARQEREHAALERETAILRQKLQLCGEGSEAVDAMLRKNKDLEEALVKLREECAALARGRQELEELVRMQDDELTLQADDNLKLEDCLDRTEAQVERERTEFARRSDTAEQQVATLTAEIAHLRQTMAEASYRQQVDDAARKTQERLVLAVLDAAYYRSDLLPASPVMPRSLALSLKDATSESQPTTPLRVAIRSIWVEEIHCQLEHVQRTCLDLSLAMLHAATSLLHDGPNPNKPEQHGGVGGSGGGSSGYDAKGCALRAVALHDASLAVDVLRLELVMFQNELKRAPPTAVAAAISASPLTALCSVEEQLGQLRGAMLGTPSVCVLREVDVLRSLAQTISQLPDQVLATRDPISYEVRYSVAPLLAVLHTSALMLQTQWSKLTRTGTQEATWATVTDWLNSLLTCEHSARSTVDLSCVVVCFAALDWLLAGIVSGATHREEGGGECAGLRLGARECLEQVFPRPSSRPTTTFPDARPPFASLFFNNLGTSLTVFGRRDTENGKQLVSFLQWLYGGDLVSKYLWDQETLPDDLNVWEVMETVTLRLIGSLNSPRNSTFTSTAFASPHQQQQQCPIVRAIVQALEASAASASKSAPATPPTGAGGAGEDRRQAVERLEKYVDQLQRDKRALQQQLEEKRWKDYMDKTEVDVLRGIRREFEAFKAQAEHRAHQWEADRWRYEDLHKKDQKRILDLSREMKDAKQQQLRQLSPLSLRERTELEATISWLQSKLAEMCGCAIWPSCDDPVRLTKKALASHTADTSSSERPPKKDVPRILRFTTAEECRQSREKVLLPPPGGKRAAPSAAVS